jgi:hypothetical protein
MGALQYSRSTHPVLYGPFRSPLDAVHGSVNTYPVLVEGGLLNAAIILRTSRNSRPRARLAVRLDRDRGGAAAA